MNALASLTEPEGLGRSVRDARLLDDAGTLMSLRQVEALLDSSKADQIDYPGGIGRLREAARRAHEKATPQVVALRAALELLQRIRETSERALGQSWAPDFSRLERSLRTVVQLMPEQAPPEPAASVSHEGDAHAQGTAQGAVAGAQAAASGAANVGAGLRATSIKEIEISSRDDVQVLLEKACQYMERTEPSHPAPMLIRRAQRLLDLNFFQIIEELVPEGLQKIESLAGRPLNGGASSQ
jgi:type VI secretion system protein ImpA